MEKIRIIDILTSKVLIKYNKGLIVTMEYPLIDFKTPDQKEAKARVPEIKIINPDKKYPIPITDSYIEVIKPIKICSLLFMPTPDPEYSNEKLFFLFKDSFRIDDVDVIGSLGKSLDFSVIMEDLTERYGELFSIPPNSGVNRRDLRYHCAAGELEETINLICKEIPSNKYCIGPFSNKTYHFETTQEKIAEFSRKIAKIF